MDDDVIDGLADVFGLEFNHLRDATWLLPDVFSLMEEVLIRSIEGVAKVINDEEPTYDLRYFYRRSGYPEPYPLHEIR